jgi:hypothetical protein
MAVTGASGLVQFGASANKVATGLGGLAGAVGNVSQLGSALRSFDLPRAGEIAGDLYAAVAGFTDLEGDNEWRVRLSLPTWPSFRTSPVLKPLVDAGGMIFPYTPEVQVTSLAKYTAMNLVHTNYNFQAYQHSEPGPITITAPMYVEDQSQGLYWIAAIHYLRALTKMFVGNDPKAGNPPPIVYLNGYGNYVLNNIPVAVTNFNTILNKDCDYISVPVVGSAAGALQGTADAIGGLADAFGSLAGIAGISQSPFSATSGLAGGVGQVAALGALFGIGGDTPGGNTYVPTKSSFSITLQPMYSRNSAQKFSLDRFVTGGYLNTGPGYT